VNKICGDCKRELPTSQFGKNRAKASGLQYRCRSCQAAYKKEWYKTHKQQVLDRNSRNKNRIRNYVRNLKIQGTCNRCSESDPSCLVFHHTEPDQKEINISRLARDGCSLSRLKEELEKCELLCANCHRKHHFSEGWEIQF